MLLNPETFVSNMKLAKGKHRQSRKDALCSMKHALHGAFFTASREILGYTLEKKLP